MASEDYGQTRDSIADVWGKRTPYHDRWPSRLDQRTEEAPERWVPSACVLCSNGCALEIGVRAGKIVGVRGQLSDPVNRGRLGPKGLHGWVANRSADRLTHPLIRRRGGLEPASWEEAMKLIVDKTREIRDQYTSHAIGIYSSGQLFLEEYYLLALLGKAGLGTPHMDANTRLCTATAAASLRESFGSDGQPASYDDIDVTEAILLVGHNPASQQTVLWMRILDRRRGPHPPKLVVIDPRVTETAKEADVHLAPRVGTNVAVMNGLLNLIIQSGAIDREFVLRHTVGYERLAETVAAWTPEKVEEVAGIPKSRLQSAAKILSTTKSLVSTVLQGVYQSMQSTAAAVQVNNLQLVRGLIGKPGCGVLQMNGQPTAQNNRECGCDGSLPAFRNWNNRAHVEELARIWNVEPETIPHGGPPTHAMQIFRYAETGAIKLLWIIATNPAVSLPELSRVRRILEKDGLFLVVQDAFPTETTAYADVVLPAALWGEKTGCFTNAERTVHLSQRAVDPPGEARADFEIFLDFARRMDFRDRDGKPLIKWKDPESVFGAWKECSRGRPCDYSGMSYAKLSGGRGIRWPCNEKFPDGAPRLYADGKFPTCANECESYGHDLVTGAEVLEHEYRARDPQGRAMLRAADYEPPLETPDESYPLWLTTGRVVFQFHTRTKTARVPELNRAAPEPFVQLSRADAQKYAIRDGQMVEVESRRGYLRARAKIGPILSGHLFVPFHYGYWDGAKERHAANELTFTGWDPVSKQPYFKYAAVRVRNADHTPVSDLADEMGWSTKAGLKKLGMKAKEAVSRIKTPIAHPHLADYLSMLRASEKILAEAFVDVSKRHHAEVDVAAGCRSLARWCLEHVEALGTLSKRYPERRRKEPERIAWALFEGKRSGGMGLLRDLHDLWLLASEVRVSWSVLEQGARALRDRELTRICSQKKLQTDRQLAWLRTRIDQVAPQALIIPS